MNVKVVTKTARFALSIVCGMGEVKVECGPSVRKPWQLLS